MDVELFCSHLLLREEFECSELNQSFVAGCRVNMVNYCGLAQDMCCRQLTSL